MAKKNKVNWAWVVAIIAIILVAWFIIISYSKVSLLSPEEANPMTYEQFNSEISPLIPTGEFLIVQLKEGEIIGGIFTTTSISTYDTTSPSQALALSNQITILENSFSTFQITTNFGLANAQTYMVLADDGKNPQPVPEPTGKVCHCSAPAKTKTVSFQCETTRRDGSKQYDSMHKGEDGKWYFVDDGPYSQDQATPISVSYLEFSYTTKYACETQADCEKNKKCQKACNDAKANEEEQDENNNADASAAIAKCEGAGGTAFGGGSGRSVAYTCS